MTVALFELAGPAIFAWLILAFAPTTRLARWLGESAIGPVYIAILYLVGVAPLMIDNPGVMREFGTAEGVTRILARQDVAMIAWLHILAFDQAIGLWIYRDNMKHRYVSLPTQSVLLFFTLMFGPVGFLAYYTIRWVRSARPANAPATFRPPPGVATASDTLASVQWVLRHERAVIAAGVTGVAIGLVDFAIIAQRGSPLVPPGGDITKAATFCLAVGLYVLTLAPLIAAANLSARMHRVLVWWLVGVMVFSFALENIQIFRGIDPRFNRASLVSGILGGVFFLVALTLIPHFILLTKRFFGGGHRITHPQLLLAVRYGIAAVMLGFLAGLWMSAVTGRQVGAAGNLLPLHAIGFHGMQAIPLLAILLVWGRVELPAAMRAVHVAGSAWLAATLAIAAQTAVGRSVDDRGIGSVVIALLLLVWVGAGLWAAAQWLRAARSRPLSAVA